MKRDSKGKFAKAADCGPEHDMTIAYMTGLEKGKDLGRSAAEATIAKGLPLHVLTDELRRRGLKVFNQDGSSIKPSREQQQADGWDDDAIRKASLANIREQIRKPRPVYIPVTLAPPVVTEHRKIERVVALDARTGALHILTI